MTRTKSQPINCDIDNKGLAHKRIEELPQLTTCDILNLDLETGDAFKLFYSLQSFQCFLIKCSLIAAGLEQGPGWYPFLTRGSEEQNEVGVGTLLECKPEF